MVAACVQFPRTALERCQRLWLGDPKEQKASNWGTEEDKTRRGQEDYTEREGHASHEDATPNGEGGGDGPRHDMARGPVFIEEIERRRSVARAVLTQFPNPGELDPEARL